jgi:hypothetical protein
MKRRLRRTQMFALLTLLAALMPPLAWAVVKPLRILAPEWNGVSCVGAVCVDRPQRLAEAQALYEAAHAAVASRLAPLRGRPLTVFCSTRTCYHAFGGGMERGMALFDLGIILAPDSWVPHIVEHELIHMLQSERIGLYQRLRAPAWYVEGMAFTLSEPPAYDLPDYAQPLVAEYSVWEARVGRAAVWDAPRQERGR